MARVKTPKAPVRNWWLISSMSFIGIALAAGIVWVLFYARQHQTLFFGRDIEQITASYEQAEKLYALSYKHIVQERTPVSESSLHEVETAYLTVEQQVLKISSPSEQTTLLEQIAERKAAISSFRQINALLQSEQTIGSHLTAFTTCVKNISFSASPTTIKGQLADCNTNLTDAQAGLLTIPSPALINCPITQTPGYIIKRIKDTHLILISYYDAVIAKDASHAASRDLDYKAKSKALKTLSSWNTCIEAAVTSQIALLN